MNNDKLIIGGHEFNSRFILGSGKYSMKLIEAAVKDAGAEIITLAVRRANTKEQEASLTISPKELPCSRTPVAREMQKKPCVLRDLPVSLAAVIS